MALHIFLSSEDPTLKRAHEVRETWHITVENVPLKHKKTNYKVGVIVWNMAAASFRSTE